MNREVYCSDGVCRTLLEKGCPLSKVYKIVDNSPIFYTKDIRDPNWLDCPSYYKPTISQAQWWLRTKGIRVYLMPIDHGNKWILYIDESNFLPEEFEDYNIGLYKGIKLGLTLL